MKIYISHSREFNYTEELYKPLKESDISVIHEIILPHETHDHPTDFVTRDIIKHVDILIAEVSYPSTGQGIELGWADACGCTIVCVYRRGARISDSLKVVCNQFYEYTDTKEMMKHMADVLARHSV